MNGIKNSICAMVLLALCCACSSIPPRIQLPDPYKESKNILVFIDGTNNKATDSSNIFKLSQLVKKDHKNLSFYTVGVGAGYDAKALGIALGVGMSEDVKEAYRFICNHYNASNQDKLYFFGFSRGAYTCKVLSNLIHLVGILNLNEIYYEKDRMDLVHKLYKAYIGQKTIEKRNELINKVLSKWQKKHPEVSLKRTMDIPVEVMGLFDTVEALAMPDYEENFCFPNSNHLHQLCTTKNIFHAASLDDNRAQIFTPILETCASNDIDCRSPEHINTVVQEVWFSGSHSDIGGNISTENALSNIPLQWMLDQCKPYNLFESPNLVKNSFATIMDAQEFYKGIFKRKNRDLNTYHSTNKHYNDGKFKIHQSVLDRLAEGKAPSFKIFEKNPLDWFDKAPFNDCFEKDGTKRIFKKDTCDCIEIIDPKP